jgi:hypothetical protein
MLLLAGSSVAGLHLFRSAKQDRAIAVQLALGASRGMLVRQAPLETTLLAIACFAAAARDGRFARHEPLRGCCAVLPRARPTDGMIICVLHELRRRGLAARIIGEEA